MPLQAVQVYNILRNKDFSDDEAQLMAGAYEHNENLATKDDIAKVKDELKGDIAAVKADLTKVKDELKGDISKIREDMLKMEGSLREGMLKNKADLKEDMAKMEGSLREDMAKNKAELKEDMLKMESSMIRWFMGTALAMTGLLSGVVFAIVKLVH
jgi:hypothetical protein